MENIREITLNSQEPAPYKAPDFAILKTKVTPEDIKNLRMSLIPQRQKRFDMIDQDKQAEYAVLFKFSEEELKHLIPFLTSDGAQTFSMNTISDALNFLDQSITDGNGKFRNLKRLVKEWGENCIHHPNPRHKEEYFEEENPVNPEELILDFMIAEGDVTEDDISAFKEKLSPDGKEAFERRSLDDRIRHVALDKMSVEKLRQAIRLGMSAKSDNVPKLHNIMGTLSFFISYINPEVEKKYTDLDMFIRKLRKEANNQMSGGEMGAYAKNRKSETEAPAKAMVA
ncbi:MAG: hypothetical protein V1867_01425 [Candidatus Falkowbacteria bacterium]